jgi:DNA-binding response OmpR family regulator
MSKPLALIVEDDRRLGDTLVDLLEVLDLRCRYSTDAAQARQKLTKLKPDLVLLDLPLYNRTGMEILTDLRIDLRLRDTKVIVITTDQYAETAELQLADAVLIKPFTFELLEETVYGLIDNLMSSDGGEFASFSSIHP